MIDGFTLLEHLLAPFVANLCLILADTSVILHEMPRCYKVTALVWTTQRVE
jgi:hypothetical protein